MSDIQVIRKRVAEAFYEAGIWPVESLIDAVTLIIVGEKQEAQEEIERLRATLSGLGFCIQDGESMPCTTCGAGL